MIAGSDFLVLAEELAANLNEAAWRTATSRAYYSAFHEARELLTALGFQVPRADRAHAYLSMRLANCGLADIGRCGRGLEHLRRERNRADYDLHTSVTKHYVQIEIQNAHAVMDALAAAASEPTRSQLLDGIRTYERDTLKENTWRP